LVPKTRLELVRLSAPEFETGVSAIPPLGQLKTILYNQ